MKYVEAEGLAERLEGIKNQFDQAINATLASNPDNRIRMAELRGARDASAAILNLIPGMTKEFTEPEPE